MKYFYHLIAVALLVSSISQTHAMSPIEGEEKANQGIDLELNYVTSPTEYSIFTNHLFILTITNNGTDNATGVKVYAPFPSSSLSFTNAETSQGDYSVWTGLWELGELASGESASLDLKLFVLNVSGEVSLFAQVQTANEEDVDSTPNNNLTQTPMEDDEAIVTITRLGGDGGGNNGDEKVDIELDMTTNHTEINVGSQFTYILSATNKGAVNATGVKVDFSLPPQVAYVGSSNGETTYDATTGEWNIGNIPSNATRSILIDVEVLIGGTISVVAEVFSVNETDSDSTPNNRNDEEDDYFSMDVLGLQIDLELMMELPEGISDVVAIGEEVTFLVYVENKGPTIGYNSKIRAILPGGLDYVESSVTMGEYLDDLGVWVIGDIPPFETQIMEITARMNVEGPLTYTCEARTSNVPDVDSTPSNFNPNEDDIDSITIYTGENPLLTDIELVTSTDNNSPKPTDSLSISISIVNNGPANASDIQIGGMLPEELIFIEATFTHGSYLEGIWRIDNLVNGEIATLNLYVIAGEFADSVTYFAQVLESNTTDIDSSPDNNLTQIPNEDDEGSVIIFPTVIDTGVGALEGITSNFSLFPIPSNDILHLQFDSNKAMEMNLVLYDLTGFLLQQKYLQTSIGENRLEVDLTSFPQGLYFLSIKTNEGSFTKKVAKK